MDFRSLILGEILPFFTATRLWINSNLNLAMQTKELRYKNSFIINTSDKLSPQDNKVYKSKSSSNISSSAIIFLQCMVLPGQLRGIVLPRLIKIKLLLLLQQFSPRLAALLLIRTISLICLESEIQCSKNLSISQRGTSGIHRRRLCSSNFTERRRRYHRRCFWLKQQCVHTKRYRFDIKCRHYLVCRRVSKAVVAHYLLFNSV